MRRHRRPGGPEEWWDHRSPGQGAQAWQGFGRKMFGRFLFFLAFFAFMVVGTVVLVVNVASNVGDLPGWLAIGAIPFLLMVIAGRSAMRSWRPVRRLIDAAGSLADGDYSVRVAPVGSGSMRAALSSFNDMAERLETADEQRRRLLADLGHEMRTPLTVVRGEIEAMLDGVHTIDAEHLDLLLNEVEVMERLLEDLRTLSLLDAGQLPLHPEPTDLGALIEDVADGYRRRAAEVGVTVTVEGDEAVGEVMLDPVRIREVLTNVVDNALRAMPDGGDLGFSVRSGEEGFVVEVTDTGSGMPQSEVDQVFDRFHKGSTSRGSGLGLTISRDLVQAHGGTISLKSTLGSGTTARIELPADA